MDPLYAGLVALAEAYRAKATKDRDFESAAIYVYLEAIRVRAEMGSGVRIYISVDRGGK